VLFCSRFADGLSSTATWSRDAKTSCARMRSCNTFSGLSSGLLLLLLHEAVGKRQQPPQESPLNAFPTAQESSASLPLASSNKLHSTRCHGSSVRARPGVTWLGGATNKLRELSMRRSQAHSGIRLCSGTMEHGRRSLWKGEAVWNEPRGKWKSMAKGAAAHSPRSALSLVRPVLRVESKSSASQKLEGASCAESSAHRQRMNLTSRLSNQARE